MSDGTQENTSAGQPQQQLLKEVGEAHAAFLRWQEVRRTQLGYVVNLILTFSTASLGFGVNLILNKPSLSSSCLFYCSLYVLIAAILLGLLTNISRLCDFRYTTSRVRARELKKRKDAGEKLTEEQEKKIKNDKKYHVWVKFFERFTWCLLYLQLSVFAVAIFLLVLSVHKFTISNTTH